MGNQWDPPDAPSKEQPFLPGLDPEAEDIKAALRIQSHHVNRVHVRFWNEMARITVGELNLPGLPSTWSYAFTMRWMEALQLADLIYREYDRETEAIQRLLDEASAQNERDNTATKGA